MKKLFLIAATAAIVFASCDKWPGGGKDDGEARMNIVISFPKAMGTRAVDNNASDKDVAVESVTVFVFDEDGNGVLGNGTSFALSDFTATGGNTYSLSQSERIQTTVGKKRVYVGINLPESLKSADNEDDLIESASTAGLEGENSVTMLSSVATPTLASQEDSEEDTPATNIVTTEVKRLVAKVAVTMGEEDYFTLSEDDPNGASFTVTPDKFTVGGLATTFYPVERLDGGMLSTPGDDVEAVGSEMRDINARGTALAALAAFYVPEHSDMSREYLQSNLTHAVVRARVGFAKWAIVGSEGVDYENVSSLTPGGFVYVFRHDGDTYFCKSASAAAAVKNELGVSPAHDVYSVDENGRFYTYYHLFLNRDETDVLAVRRNQFFDITITGANGLGSPSPIAPDEPLLESTYLEVSVDVLAWDYRPMDRVLGE